jgi:hypothetical protein
MMIYNMGAGILRPWEFQPAFYFLIFSRGKTLLVRVCDRLQLGIAGGALARSSPKRCRGPGADPSLTRSDGPYKTLEQNAHRRRMLKKIWVIGIPSAFSRAITSFSNLLSVEYQPVGTA